MLSRLAPLALLTCALVLPAAATAPATMPTADYSAPKPAVAAFLAALEASNAKALHAAIIASPEDQPAADAIINLWVAQATLYTAAKDRFGDAADQPFGAVNSQIQTRLKTLENAPVKITGDSAVITLPPDESTKQPGGTIVLRKIANDWKLDAATLFSLDSAPKEKTDQRIALARKLVAVTQQTAEDIAAGKFPSATEAYQEFWNRSLAAANEIDHAATQPK